MNHVTFESPADLLGKMPITLTLQPGFLRLSDGRLTFRTADGAALLDAAARELHSPVVAAMGIHVWHGSTRYRFAFGRAVAREKSSKEPKQLAAQWVSTLEPLVGRPPQGMHVNRPWPSWAWLASIVGIIGVFTVLIVTLVSIIN